MRRLRQLRVALGATMGLLLLLVIQSWPDLIHSNKQIVDRVAQERKASDRPVAYTNAMILRSLMLQAHARVEQIKMPLASAQTGVSESLAATGADALDPIALESERAIATAQQQRLQQQLNLIKQQLEQAQQREDALRQQLKGVDVQISASRPPPVIENSAEAFDLVLSLELEIGRREAELAQLRQWQSTDEILPEVESTAFKIAMLSPEVSVTRGVRSVTLLSEVNEYELVGQITSYDQLIAFKVNDRNALDEIGDQGIFRIRVPIEVSASTPVSIEAVRADGTMARERFVINQDTPQIAASRDTSVYFRDRMHSDLGRFHALVIGNNDYASHDPLSTAVNDAKAVAAILRQRYGYAVNLLTDADHEDMVRALTTQTKAMAGNDNLLIYYAGHGLLGDEGKGYWLPVDAGPQADESWISNAQISDLLSATQAKHVLVVADSCYSGSLSGAAIRPIPLAIDDQDLLFISRVKARTVLTSGGLQPVLDEGGDGHSIFGRAFIKAIYENTDLMEGYRLFDKLTGEVSRRSRLARTRQNPEYSALRFLGHEGGEFFFLPLSNEVAPIDLQIISAAY